MRTSPLAALGWLGLIAANALGHEGTPSEFNYRDDVRPVFVKHCAGCHQPGGVAPMSLLSYSDAVPWANAVKIQVLEAQMPPWLPADGIGSFEHTRSLSADEIDIIIDWVIGQTPEGPPMTAAELERDAEPPWEMGIPDLVLAPDSDVIIGEDDYELTECLVLPTGLAQAKMVTAFEVKPGAATLVRRATIRLGDRCEDTRPLVTWLPGQGQVAFEGRGHEIPAGATLAVQLLYVKGWEDEGERITDRSELGLQFSDTAVGIDSLRIDGPTHTFASDIEIVALYPEGDPGDAPLRIDVAEPGGSAVPILLIEQFRAEWREKYVLSQPMRLRGGTTLTLSQTAVWIDFIELSSASAE